MDRYKFLDLYPCSNTELRSIGYTDVASIISKHNGHYGTSLAMLLEDEPKLPRPDITQMIPYKPKAKPLSGEHPVPGGSFPFPPSVAHLCTLLPPPTCFVGPFVAVDLLCDVFDRIQLPDAPPAPTTENGCDTKLFELAKSVHWIVDNQTDTFIGAKRARLHSGDNSDGEDKAPPPAHDLYRLRQKNRLMH